MFDTALNILTLLAVMFAVYKHFRDPDVEAKLEIALMKQKCELMHTNINKDIVIIKNNHLAHIEKDIVGLKENQAKMLTILDERLPNRK